MTDFKRKIIYLFAIVVLAIIGMGIGYFKISMQNNVDINNISALEFAKNYELYTDNDRIITASTKTYDVTVRYEDYYTVCKETITNSKVIYGTSVDQVKIDEKKYQENNGLVYEIKEETEDEIVYTRKLNQNCPNHFQLIYEDGVINIYSIQGENKRTLYLKIEDINVEQLREELKQKVEKGIYINSREELNKFIEDLES